MSISFLWANSSSLLSNVNVTHTKDSYTNDVV